MTDIKQQLANKANNVPQKSQKKGMEQMLTLMADEIKKALPDHIKSERFQRMALTAFNGNKKLQQCDPVTFLAAMMQSAQLGLEPNTPLGQAYLIPYGNTVQFQVGYKGLLELAYRTKEYKNIFAYEVYENDEFEIEYGLNPKLKHKPVFDNRGEIIGYYAVFKLINGGESFAYMTRDEVENHAKKFSKTFGSGPWKSDFDSMAKKTVLKQLLKYAPLSTELQDITAIDEKVAPEVPKEKIGQDDIFEVDWSYADPEAGEIKE
mgnify:CR=1 FL=1